ncbi:MAG: uridine kinase [Candidatus Eisenbacteria bacterium]|nr:uridine kinase [Candidatus Eisenbacteria bacterium]
MSRGVLIGIAGGSASGKTLVAAKIYEALGPDGVAILKQDSYYRDLADLTPEERARVNFDHPDAFDTPLLLEQVSRLLGGEPIEEPIYDFTRHARSERTRRVLPVSVVILEGILVLAERELRALMDIKVFVDTDSDVRLLRRLRRDIHERGRTVESVLSQYETYVRPMHLEFIEPSKRFADVIIPEGGHNRVGVDLLATKVQAVRNERYADAGARIEPEPRTHAR